MGFGGLGLGFNLPKGSRVCGWGFGSWGLRPVGSGVLGIRFRVKGFGVWCLGFRV